jgi:diadenosine tetraphosphate (Ap4A) HIT family hydrolase
VEFWQILRRIETALRTAFDVTLFNWGCYMNLSYRENPPQPHIHWWAVPRYNHPVTVGTMVFTDPDFGSPYDHGRWLETPPDIRRQIVEQLELA